jgi:hypothetical protein
MLNGFVWKGLAYQILIMATEEVSESFEADALSDMKTDYEHDHKP